MENIEKIDKGIDIVQKVGKLTETKAGNFALGILFSASTLGFLVWFLYNLSEKRFELVVERDKQIESFIQREKDIKDECYKDKMEFLNLYMDMENKTRANMQSFMTIEQGSKRVVEQQSEIINNLQ